MHPLIALLGDEHPHLGAVAVESLGDHTAIALSAGRLPKSYWHMDPNEDGALAMEAGPCRVLAVADGHNGFDAALAALSGVFDAIEHGSDEDAPQNILGRCVESARDHVTRALERLVDDERADSRTALSIAVTAPDRLYACTYGDTVVTRVRGQRLKHLPGDAPFLGPGAEPARLNSATLKQGDVVILASDGVTDFLGRLWRDRFADAVIVSSPTATAEALVELACLGGAGDHVSVAVSVVG